MTVTEASSAASRVSAWLFERAIPHYCRHGVGPHGLAYEEFDFDGRPKDTDSARTMVQFRQIYVLSHAALLGRCDPALASALFARVTSVAWSPDGGWVHRVRPDGRAIDGPREAYDQAFSLLACAWIHELTGAREALERARTTLRFLDERMRGDDAGYLDALPSRLPRRQNPHMHLYEGLLALFETSGDESFLARAEVLRALLETRFVSPRGGLREYFDLQLRAAAGDEGRVVEPGHHFEWVWLLHQAAELGLQVPPEPARRLYAFGMEHGRDARGFAVDECDPAGRIVRPTRRAWPQTELIKAALVTGDHATAAAATEAVLGSYLATEVPGLWIDQFDEEGRAMADTVPASTFYHLMVAFSELQAAARSSAGSGPPR